MGGEKKKGEREAEEALKRRGGGIYGNWIR